MVNRNPAIADDLYNRQQETINSLKEDNAELIRKLEYYKDLAQELFEIKAKFANQPHLYSQLMQPPNPAEDYRIKQLNQNREAERLAKIAADAEEQRQAEEKAFLDENPSLQNFYKDSEHKIIENRDKLLKAAEDYYDLDDDQIKVYTANKHRPERSAVKLLLQTYQDKSGFQVYQCLHCEEEFQSLAEFEQHCYWQPGPTAKQEQASHRTRLLQLIESDAEKSLDKLRKEMSNDVRQGIQAKKDAEFNKKMQQQRSNLSQAAKGLPYVS